MHTLKVICISKGLSKNARESETLRDGWGAPKNATQEPSQQTNPSEEPRDAA
jgi:hypothetical protein